MKESDRIVGCSHCERVGVCKKCVAGFTVTADGKWCVDDYWIFWRCVYFVLGSAGVVLFLYLILLSNRPVINQPVLEQALMHRDHRKVWQEREDHAFHQYDFTGTNLVSTDISGQGVLLYFGFLTFACFLAGVLLVGAFCAYEFSDLKEHRENFKKGKDDLFEHCSASTEHLENQTEAAYGNYNMRMFVCMLLTYIFVLFSSMLMVYYQTNVSYRWDENNSTHEDYALLASRLPEEATDPNELTSFFQKALDEELEKRGLTGDPHMRVIGVSIAYDYKEHQELIDNCLKDWIEDIEIEKERRTWKSRPHRECSLAGGEDSRSCSTNFCSIAKLEFLDYIFYGSCVEEQEKHHEEEQIDRRSKIKGVLESLQGSGFAYVIGAKPAVLDVIEDIFSSPDAPRFREKKITISEVLSEPPSLYWENFTEMNFWPRIIFGMFVTLMTIILWLGVYMVYAVSYSKYVSVPGAKPSFFQDTLLGLLVAVGNAIVAQVVDIVTQWAGYRQKDRRDIAILSMAFLATLLNTACDLWMVMQIARGVQLTNNFQGKSDGYDHVIAGELFGLIVPGYLIIPYIATPMIEHVLPYLMGTWYIRSRKTSLRDAEACLACPEFDICWRYSDIMNNFTICSIMLIFISPNSYRVMIWLVIFLVMIMGIDKYKLLRQTSQTFYTTRRLDNAAQLWWSFPTGILASITVWWGCKAELLPWMKDHHTILCSVGFAIHVVIYLSLWTVTGRSVPPAKTETTSYEDMCTKLWEEGKVWSYFNTNPVFCLRSKYLDKQASFGGSPCVPYVPGKVFLQQGVPLKFASGEESVMTALASSVTGGAGSIIARLGTHRSDKSDNSDEIGTHRSSTK
jgi:hypothetical protein